MVVGACCDPVEDRNLVDGQGVACVEVLRIARHRAQVLQLVLDGVLYLLPFLGIGVAVDEASGLIDVGLGLCRVIEGESLGEVITHLVVTRPVPLL